jgi:hypothetical protein
MSGPVPDIIIRRAITGALTVTRTIRTRIGAIGIGDTITGITIELWPPDRI